MSRLVPIHGALVLDKREGSTSSQVVTRLKKAFLPSSIGHAGTLDPMATGVLVVLLGYATRLQEFVMHGEKEYHGSFRTGLRTSTDDIWGEVLEESNARLTAGEFAHRHREVLERFSGVIEQVPPQVSAVKVDGWRSYERVREGQTVALAPRRVEIRKLRLEFVSPVELRYELICSKGTYVRSLARDVGEYLGIPMVVSAIRRVRSGQFLVARALREDDIRTLAELEKQVISLRDLLPNLPFYPYERSGLRRLYLGDQTVLPSPDVPGWEYVSGKEVLGVPGREGNFAGLLERNCPSGRWRVRFLIPEERVD